MAVSESQKRATKKYNDSKTRHYGVRFMCGRDADIIAKLDSVDNKTNYIRKLIIKDIKHESAQQTQEKRPE